jgi:DNA-binding CsgD family transcriptional regulator
LLVLATSYLTNRLSFPECPALVGLPKDPPIREKRRFAVRDGTHSYELSSEEMRVLKLLADGLSDEQIAAELGVTQRTLEECMAGVLRKMESRSRTEAAVKAIKRHLLGISVAAALLAAMIVMASSEDGPLIQGEHPGDHLSFPSDGFSSVLSHCYR